MNQKKNKQKIAVGLSGGVDSSVTAYLLTQQGYDVTGVYIQCWESRADGCTADTDKLDAIKICSQLGIKFVYLDFIKEYKAKVISYFYDEYKAGRTPNPDIVCNTEIKFGLFLDWGISNGFDYIATGHYAQVSRKDTKYQLLMGSDTTKDQSYFLYRLKQKQLARVLFPIGHMKKAAVRALAKEVGLHTFDKPDSVGICFIGEVDIKSFLQKRIKPRAGPVINTKGDVLGEHSGVWFYTVGQRHGFRIDSYVGLPMYVIGKNVSKNELIVGFAKESLTNHFEVSDSHFIGDIPKMPFSCNVRIRHLGELHPSIIINIENSSNLLIKPKSPLFGVAPGQSAVFYDDSVVLGGGIIAD